MAMKSPQCARMAQLGLEKRLEIRARIERRHDSMSVLDGMFVQELSGKVADLRVVTREGCARREVPCYPHV